MAEQGGAEQRQVYYAINRDSTIFLKKITCSGQIPALVLKLFYPSSFLDKESGDTDLIESKRELVVPAYYAVDLALTILKLIPDRSTIAKPNSNFFGEFTIPAHFEVIFPLEEAASDESKPAQQSSVGQQVNN